MTHPSSEKAVLAAGSLRKGIPRAAISGLPRLLGHMCGSESWRLICLLCCAGMLWSIQCGVKSAAAVQEDDAVAWAQAVEMQGKLALDDFSGREQLLSHVVSRLREKSAYREVVRRSLRLDSRGWVRVWAAAILLKALGREARDDCLYMLSDPDPNVRGLANGAIKKYELTDLAACFPALLLRADHYERLAGMRGIERFLGEKGLPYYSILIADKDVDVACEAAKGFGLCRKEDAVPHLLAFLKKNGRSHRHQPVVVEVVKSLERLFGEVPQELEKVPSAAETWIQRLCREGYSP